MNKKIQDIDSLEEYKTLNKDLFELHKATIQKLESNEGRDCIITFKRDDTSCGAMMFTYLNGVLSVNGDYGYATYNWYNKRNHILAYGNFNSFGYILSKIVASENYKEFNKDLFHKEFEVFTKMLVDEEYVTQKIIDYVGEPYGIESSCDVQEFINNCELHDKLDIETLWDFGVYDFGVYITERPYIWWYGLQSVLKQLEERGEFDD